MKTSPPQWKKLKCSEGKSINLWSIARSKTKLTPIPQNVNFLLNVFGVGVLCRNLFSFVNYLYVNCSGLTTSVGEERASLSAVVDL